LEAETNLPIGVEDHYHYEEQQIEFPEGSALLLYTDGLTEAVYKSNTGNRKLFGEDRVLHDVDKNRMASAPEIIDYLKQHVTIFADGTEQGDDLTLMFIRHGKTQDKGTSSSRRIIMKNEMSEVSRMRGFFFSVCREYGISDETAKMLNLAIEEWVANVINYAYPKGTRGHVEMTANVSPSRLLTVVIKDHGVPFDPTSYAEVDVDAELDERTIGGLGIHMVRGIMDSMNYERTANGYNVLTLTKALDNHD
jgi:sigma-B regulation protein RsbU (phosphoserine phosphatase)